jgi:uncharacterized delta-60 repeat protein
MRSTQSVVVRRIILPLRRQLLDELNGFAPCRRLRSPLDYRLEALERRIVCAAGDLDPTFGSGGLAFPPASSSGTLLLDIGPGDGRIVVGTIDTPTNTSRLFRYRPDGQLDLSFGEDGVVTFEFTPPTGAWGGVEEFADLVVLANGKIIALGNNLAGNTNIRSAMHGFNADGSVDTSFGDNGVVLLDNLGWPQMRAGADGRIFVFADAAGSANRDGLVLCFNGDGSADLTFGEAGRAQFDLGADEEIRTAAIGPAGEIVLAVMTQASESQTGVAAVRLTSQGQLDSTFGEGGKVVIGRPESRLVISDRVCVMSDGRIVVAAVAYSTDKEVPPAKFVTRLRTEGSPDTSFGDGGTVSTPALSQLINVQADGKIVFADTQHGLDGNDHTRLGRLTADGRPDDSFGENGICVHDLGELSESVSGMKLTADGDILVAGTVGGAVSLARFDAGELSELPPAEPPPAEPPLAGPGEQPGSPARSTFGDVRPVGEVEEEDGSAFRAWADDLLDPEPDEEELFAGLI